MLRRTTPLLLAVLAVLAAACGGDDGDTGDTGTDTTADGGSDAALVTCANPGEGYEIDHPEDWETNPGEVMPPCSLFDPEPIDDIEPGTEIPTDIAVRVRVEPIPYEDLVSRDSQAEEVLARDEPVVADLTVTRLETEATGDALLEEGTRSTRWIVDLGDDRSLVASTIEHEGGDYEEYRAVLDRMVGTLTLTDGDDGSGTTTTTTTTPPDEASPEPVGTPGTAPREADGFPSLTGDTAFLSEVRAAARPGFDRVVFEFQGDDPPSYRVGPAEPPITEAGSGREVDVEGSHFLSVSVAPASGVDLRGEEVREIYQGPDRVDVPGAARVTEVVQTGDFEGHLDWVIGLDGPTPFSVALLEDPVRLVVDVVPGE